MSNTELHHLLNRALDGVVLHGESDRLRALVRQLEERTATAEAAVERVRQALTDAEWGGPDRHDVITEISAALDQPQPTAPTCRSGPYDDCPNCHPEQQPTL